MNKPAPNSTDSQVRDTGLRVSRPRKILGKLKFVVHQLRRMYAVWFTYAKELGDPLRLDPRVTLHGKELNFTYTYYPEKEFKSQTLDEEGFAIIPMWGQWYRQPIIHCNSARFTYHQYLETNDPAAREEFLRKVEILLKAGETRTIDGTHSVVWPIHYKLRAFEPHSTPWLSALAQGRAISVLCRAYQLTGKQEYLDAAHTTLPVFELDVEEGGVAARDQRGNVYYEEFAVPGRSYHILNGFLTALFSLHELWRVCGDPLAKKLFDRGVATFRAEGVLEAHDSGCWTRYDQRPNREHMVTDRFYNWLHTRQMWILYKITGDEYFRQWAMKWARYDRETQYIMRAFFGTLAYHLKTLPKYVKRALS